MEARLFEEGTIPEWTTHEFYAGREAAPHLEQEGHRQRLMLSAAQVNHALAAYSLHTFSDLGAGDGGLLSLVHAWEKWGYDLQQSNVDAAAARDVSVELADVVTDIDRIALGQVVGLTEILEHLVDPHGLLARLHRQLTVRAIVASSPYTETAESHYDFHTWAWDQPGYAQMFAQTGWRVVQHDSAWICQSLLAVRA